VSEFSGSMYKGARRWTAQTPPVRIQCENEARRRYSCEKYLLVVGLCVSRRQRLGVSDMMHLNPIPLQIYTGGDDSHWVRSMQVSGKGECVRDGDRMRVRPNVGPFWRALAQWHSSSIQLEHSRI